MLTYRQATVDDVALLAEMNHQLIQDEHHRNAMSVPELTVRMEQWLKSEYRAVLFERAGEVAGYALYRPERDATYLRQFFVRREQRRKGLGRAAITTLLRTVLATEKRVYLDVLTGNSAGHAFWKAVGFRDYAVTLEMVRPTEAPQSVLP